MNIKKRKILFLLFVLAFLVIASIMIFYAQGYRANISWPPNFNQSLQRTGMILVETEPRGAEIYINGETPQSWWQRLFSREEEIVRTPTRIRNVKPGEHLLSVEMNGYHSWERKIEVLPGRITTISELYLLKRNLPLNLTSNEVSREFLSPDQKKIISLQDSKMIDLETSQITPLPELTPESNIVWSPDSKKIILDEKLFDLEEKKVELNLEEILRPGITEVSWHPRGDKLYFLDQNSLKELNLNTKKGREILSSEQKIFTIFPGQEVFFLIKEEVGENLMNLEIYNYSEFRKIRSIEIPFSEKYEITATPRPGLISLYDRRFKDLYLLKPLSPVVLRESLKNVSYFEWRNNQEIVYGNDFEIWTFNLVSYDKEIITRLSQKIKGVAVLPKCRKIVYYHQDRINTLDLENDRLNKTELASLNNLSDLFSSKSEGVLYFNAQVGNRTGLHKLIVY